MQAVSRKPVSVSRWRGRLERCKKFNETVLALRGDRTNIYPATLQIILGNGHTGLPDRDQIADMYPAIRNPIPRELTWLMTDPIWISG
jgi:hypothetical protein